jgi:hypothetical protein
MLIQGPLIKLCSRGGVVNRRITLSENSSTLRFDLWGSYFAYVVMCRRCGFNYKEYLPNEQRHCCQKWEVGLAVQRSESFKVATLDLNEGVLYRKRLPLDKFNKKIHPAAWTEFFPQIDESGKIVIKREPIGSYKYTAIFQKTTTPPRQRASKLFTKLMSYTDINGVTHVGFPIDPKRMFETTTALVSLFYIAHGQIVIPSSGAPLLPMIFPFDRLRYK